jgi:hypothetical protein
MVQLQRLWEGSVEDPAVQKFEELRQCSARGESRGQGKGVRGVCSCIAFYASLVVHGIPSACRVFEEDSKFCSRFGMS